MKSIYIVILVFIFVFPLIILAKTNEKILVEKIKDANQLSIRSLGSQSKDVFTIKNTNISEIFIEKLDFDKSKKGISCRCKNQFSYSFYKNNKLLAEILQGCPSTLRMNGWSGDQFLTEKSVNKLAEYLASHGYKTLLDSLND